MGDLQNNTQSHRREVDSILFAWGYSDDISVGVKFEELKSGIHHDIKFCQNNFSSIKRKGNLNLREKEI